jgi:ABC-type Zn uptake system ZnuABC Zn-binding protein ZnuA
LGEHALVRVVAALVAVTLLAAACTGGRKADSRSSRRIDGRDLDERAPGEPPRSNRVVEVVATNSVVADLVRIVGSTNVRTHTVVKAGLDPLSYRVTTADREQATRSAVVFGVGRGLEPWLTALGGKRTVLVSDGLPERRTPSGVEDPFVWHDADNAKAILRTLARVLGEIDAADGPAFTFAAEAAVDKVDAADADARRVLGAVAGHALVTTKESMGWFAARYGLVSAGSVIPSPSSAAEVPAQHLTDLKAAVAQQRALAVFGEMSSPAGPALALARETGLQAVTGADALCGDGLGPAGSDSDTYLGCLTHNAREIAAHV